MKNLHNLKDILVMILFEDYEVLTLKNKIILEAKLVYIQVIIQAFK